MKHFKYAPYLNPGDVVRWEGQLYEVGNVWFREEEEQGSVALIPLGAEKLVSFKRNTHFEVVSC